MAIKNHFEDGREIHLFKKISTSEYMYEDKFEYIDHQVKIGLDMDKKKRNTIAFTIRKKEF